MSDKKVITIPAAGPPFHLVGLDVRVLHRGEPYGETGTVVSIDQHDGKWFAKVSHPVQVSNGWGFRLATYLADQLVRS